jgi:nucleotide-binding universal stress UspA family protein
MIFAAGKRTGKTCGPVELEPLVVQSNTLGSGFCVTRRGEGGIRAQKEAIRIAKDRGEPLVFLYVADSSFLNKLAAPIVVDINHILESLGRFLLYTSIEYASAEGVKAESLIRHGAVREVLPIVVSQIGATTIIMGHPTGDPSCFERDEMDRILVSTKE